MSPSSATLKFLLHIINYVIVNFYKSYETQTYMHLSFLFKFEKLLPEG